MVSSKDSRISGRTRHLPSHLCFFSSFFFFPLPFWFLPFHCASWIFLSWNFIALPLWDLLHVIGIEGDVTENIQLKLIKSKTARNYECLRLRVSFPSASVLWFYISFCFHHQILPNCVGIDNGLDSYDSTERQNRKLQHQLEQRTGILRSDPSLLPGRFRLSEVRSQE